MESKKRYSAQEKVHILRDWLEHGRVASDISEAYNVSLGVLYQWRKHLFEDGFVVFENKRSETRQKKEVEDRIRELEATLAVRENVISELASEVIELKKKTSGANLRLAGQSNKRGTRSSSL